MDNPNIEKLNGLNASQLEELVNQAIKKIDGRRLHAKEKEVRKAIDENKVILARRGINKRAFVVRCSGLDGSGKSYLSKIIKDNLVCKEYPIKFMDENFGELPSSYNLRQKYKKENPEIELSFKTNSRLQHLMAVAPKYGEKITIYDERCFWDSIEGYLRNVSDHPEFNYERERFKKLDLRTLDVIAFYDSVISLLKKINNSYIVPDTCIFLTANPRVAWSRAYRRAIHSRIEYINPNHEIDPSEQNNMISRGYWIYYLTSRVMPNYFKIDTSENPPMVEIASEVAKELSSRHNMEYKLDI